MNLDDLFDDDDVIGAPPSLRNLDSVLRCPICGDHINTAVMFPICSHTYCSLCIRRSLEFKEECPTCRKKILPSDLVLNRIVDRAVAELKVLKADLRKAFSSSSHATPISHTHVRPSTNQSLPPRVTNSKNTPSRSITPQVQEDGDFFIESLEQSVKTADQTKDVTDDESKSSGRSAITNGFQEAADGSKHRKVQCPACGTDVLEDYINPHLDRCLANDAAEAPNSPIQTNRASLTSASAETRRKPLQKYFYLQMKEKALRDALKEHGLPTKGDRPALIQRLKEFVLLYNSQMDSAKPLSKADMVAQIMREEKARGEKPVLQKGVKLASKSFDDLAREIHQRSNPDVLPKTKSTPNPILRYVSESSPMKRDESIFAADSSDQKTHRQSEDDQDESTGIDEDVTLQGPRRPGESPSTTPIVISDTEEDLDRCQVELPPKSSDRKDLLLVVQDQENNHNTEKDTNSLSQRGVDAPEAYVSARFPADEKVGFIDLGSGQESPLQSSHPLVFDVEQSLEQERPTHPATLPITDLHDIDEQHGDLADFQDFQDAQDKAEHHTPNRKRVSFSAEDNERQRRRRLLHRPLEFR